jgi:hypothetical protein
MDVITQATIYLLKYQGQRATEKQVTKFLANPANRMTVIRMATERGFQASN